MPTVSRTRRGCNPFAGLGKRLHISRLNLIIVSLVVNTGLAQLFYNSAGVILPIPTGGHAISSARRSSL